MVKYDLCRLAGKHQLPMDVRQHLYETIRNQVLASAAQGYAPTKVEVEVDVSNLPGISIAKGWKVTRKLQYELMPDKGSN